MIDAARDLYLLVAVLGLMPAVNLAGMPVLAQSAFVAVGGVGALQLERAGLPIGGAVLLAIVLGAVAGALTGGLVARSEPPFVALATWALAWLAYEILLGFPSLSGGAQGLTRPAEDRVETPFGLSLTLTPTFHLVAAIVLCVLAYAAVLQLRAGPRGNDALALRDDPELAASLRVPAARRRVELLALAGAAGAAAGAGIALALGVAAPADVSPLLALQLLAAALAGARYPLLAAVVIVAVARLPEEITPFVLLAAVALRRAVPERTRTDTITPPADLPALPPPRTPAPPGGADEPRTRAADSPPAATALAARGLEVTLGGRAVLGGVDMNLEAGSIHALIGPNGSGKTTVLRVLAGALAPDKGTLEGGPVARTFQREASFPALTPYRQILLALRATYHDEHAWALLALIGLTDKAHATDLTPGEQRLLQVARAVATGAPVLALDEPAVGMTASERQRLADIVKTLAEHGRAVLVVEHDLRLVAALADVVSVLDDGGVIAHGAPDAVIGDDAVQRVYLGVAA